MQGRHAGAARLALRDQWYDAGWYGKQLVRDVLLDGVERSPDTPIIFETTTGRSQLSLRQVIDQAERVAAGLHASGLRAGDVVAVQLPNWPETAVAYAAVALMGGVLLPIVHIYGPAETNYILRDSGARRLIMPDRWGELDYLARLGDVSALPDLDGLIVVGETVPDGALPFADLAAEADDDRERPSVEPPAAEADDCALILYTSGTTAAPKGVQHSHNSLLIELRTTPTPPLEDGTVCLQPFPAGHIAGLTSLLGPFVHGYPTVLMDRWDARRAADVIDDFGVTAMAGTPFHISTLLDVATGDRCSSLRHIVTGGAGVPPTIVEQADEKGWRVARCYGSSEQPTITTSRSEDPLDVRAHTDGLPLPGCDVRIADDGEVQVIGPDQFIGYTDPELDERSFTADGWFRTGDIGRLVDGRLTIVDRKKDIIIRGGENISSSEVEAILVTHEAVVEAAVIPVPDERYGERVGAAVMLRPGAQLEVGDVGELFREAGVARQKTPERLFVVEDFPRTAAGKVKKHELRATLLDG